MKTLIETAAQAAGTKHETGVCFVCSACNCTLPVQTSGGTGYARTAANAIICYDCADKAQREDLKDRTKPFCAYVSGDGSAITTWTGGKLMTVTQSRPCQLMRMSFTHDRKSYRSIRARDVHGGMWYGRGSAGICIRLRPCAS